MLHENLCTEAAKGAHFMSKKNPALQDSSPGGPYDRFNPPQCDLRERFYRMITNLQRSGELEDAFLRMARVNCNAPSRQ